MTPFRTRPARLILAILAAGALLAACGGGGDDDAEGVGGDTTASSTADGPAGEGEANQIVMKLVAFSPEDLEVAAGTTVTWSQQDPGSHTVTSGTVRQDGAGVTPQPDGRFDSGDVAKGDTFEHTFEEAGTYPYYCSLHPATMRGEIRVT